MSDSQARTAYEYRAFLLQVSEGLTQEDCQKIVFLEELPPELEGKPPLNVLIQLEMHGKLSASRPDDLAKLLKRIPRHDLAKKVREFVKQQRKGRAALSPLQRIDHSALKLSASLEVTLLQCKILLEQVENLREEAEEAGYKRVEEVVADAQAMISEHVKRKFLYASKLIPQEAEGREQAICSDRDRRGSTPSSPDSPLSSLEFDTSPPQFPPQPLQPLQPVGGIRLPMATHTDMHASELKAAVENRHIKSQSLSRSSKGKLTNCCKYKLLYVGVINNHNRSVYGAYLSNHNYHCFPPIYTATGSPAKQLRNTKQPLVPPTSQRQVKAYDTTPPSPGCRVAGSSMSSSASPTASALAGARQVIPGAEQAVLGTTQLVTGRLTPKPTPPPKPKFKKG